MYDLLILKSEGGIRIHPENGRDLFKNIDRQPENQYIEYMAGQNSFESDILDQVDEGLKEPDMYRVLLLNDDYTTQDFVIEVLVKIFHKQPVDATRIMLDVHKKGRGMVGLYPFDIANTKVNQVRNLAKQREYPLKCVMERA